MSLDYPQYAQIRARSRQLGWLWQLGDKGYYIGLLGAVLTPVLLSAWKAAHKAEALLEFALLFSGFVLILLLSSVLKGYVHKQAKQAWPEIYTNEN
ncbi:MAG: hypothetical protein HYR56_29755 [Acidobacteria bacterium]|nr:hypothetical protein [Acidobacteriota bacterium]MBI3421451.1 hypothetical protein [Acidobacteriota bacterium]